MNMRSIIGIIFFYCLVGTLQAQDMQRVKRVLDTLCSPEMAGRGYLEAGDKKAASYIAQQFKEIGLQSFNEDYFQFFQLSVNTFPKKIRLRLDRKKLTLGDDYIVNAVSSTARGGGRIYYLDTLIFTDQTARETFLNTDVDNKVLVYHRKDYERLAELPVNVVKKVYEAKAVIELQDKLTAAVSTKAIETAIFEVDSSLFAERPTRARFRITNEFIEKYTSQNVIGYVEGTTYPSKFLVITAHYDHLGKMDNIYFPGANDNASGISMLLELARHYKKNRPAYSIVFMAFGAEEVGLIGSQYYTEHPLFPLDQIRFLINIDLVGTGDDGITVVNGSVFERGFKLLQEINEQNQYIKRINKRGAAPNSDHYFFYRKKVPSFFIYTLGGIKAYHDVNDKAATLPLTSYKEVFALLTEFFDQI